MNLVEGFLIFTGVSTGYLHMGWSGPSGATSGWTSDGVTGGSSVGPVERTGLGISNVGFAHVVNISVRAVAMPKGLLRVSSTAGTFRFRWYQANSQATATTVYANLWLRQTS
ncbi:hypothetical protein ABT294_28960 [Nonomuraea sp. NPDC000554]|uniref:hypothetical protein n=1 Tax=Nonomuraea sp. NPDC000554 TaxID=3154259 RepID=UPI0033348CA1